MTNFYRGEKGIKARVNIWTAQTSSFTKTCTTYNMKFFAFVIVSALASISQVMAVPAAASALTQCKSNAHNKARV